MVNQNVKPSRKFYLIPLTCILVSVYIFVSLVLGVLNMHKSLERVIMPGETVVTLTETGNYIIFYEHKSVVDNRTYSTGEDLPNLEYRLVAEATGAQVPLVSTGSRRTTYTGDTHSGLSVFNFSIEHPGNYKFSAWYPGRQRGKEVVFAIGQPLPLGRMFASVGILFLLVFGGGAIFIVIFVMRQKSKKREATTPNTA